MAKMTILQVVPRLETGGSELTTVEVAEALTRAGAEALVATEGGRMTKAISRTGGEVIAMPVASKNPITMLRNADKLARLIAERGVDLVHARSRAPAWSALLAARRTGRPFVTTYHGAYSSPGPLKALYNSVMGRGDRIIANSFYTADLVAKRHHVARDRIRVIYRGLDSATFDPMVVPPGPVKRLREDWGVSPGTTIVLHAARLSGIKGQRQTIEAAARLKSDGVLQDTCIVLAGDAQGKSAYRQELLDLVEKHGLQEKVKLVGHCRDMPVAFLAADVALVPSLVAETFGRTSIEAQAMGCPVIVSELGALPETIGGGEKFTGWCVPAGDAMALADCIKSVLALSPEDRAAVGARGRARVGALFDLAQMQMKTLAVYDELLGSNLVEMYENPPAFAAIAGN